jgi:multidrug efflux pump subunit AcrB
VRRALQAPYRLGTWAPRATLVGLFLLVGIPLWALPESVSEEGGSVPERRLAGLYNDAMQSEAVTTARAWLDPAFGGIVRPFVRQTAFGESARYEAEPEVYVRLGFPPGNPIARADSLLHRFEQVALASGSVRRTVARVRERSARLRVLFREGALEAREPFALRARLIRKATLLAGIDVSVGGLLPQGYASRSGTNVSGFTVAAYGPSYEDLAALTERFARALKQKSRRVATVTTDAGRYGSRRPREVLRFRLGADAQARLGVSPRRLTRRLRPALSTDYARLRADLDGAPQIPVRIRTEGADRRSVRALADRPLVLAGSTHVKLGSAASYAVETVPSRIVRENQQYKRYVQVDFRGPHRMGEAFLKRALEGFSTPPGYRLKRQETTFWSEGQPRALGWSIFGTVVLVFLVTATVFESWRLPGVVLLSVPTALVGVAAAFLLAGDLAFGNGAFIGSILLVGLAANDSILLTDHYRRLRADHPHRTPGVLARLALRERLRPMWATTLSSCVAMLPMLVFPQEGTFWTGMAVTVTGGLVAATLLAPLMTAALLQIVD